MHCNRNTTCNGSLVYLLSLKRCDVGQKCRCQLREEHELTSSLDVPIFSLDESVSRKDPHVSARHKLRFPSQWKTTYNDIQVQTRRDQRKTCFSIAEIHL